MGNERPPQQAHESAESQRWGIVAGTFWAFVAFFVPQFLLVPFVGFIDDLRLDENARLFLLQGVSELGAVLLLWLVIRRIYRAGFQDLGLGRFNPLLFGWSILALPAYLIISIFVTNLFAWVFPSVDLLQTQDIGYTNPNGWVLSLVFVALVCLAPFVEEVLFRGFLFNAFRRTFGFWVGALCVSALFAIAHRQLNVGLDVFVLSMVLCYVREKTHSLWPAIGLHALKNLVAFTYLFIIHFK